MDIASLIGMLMALVLMLFSIMSGDQGPIAIKGFLDWKSALITFGGAFCAILMATKDIKTYVGYLKSFTLIMKPMVTNEAEVIKNIIDLSNVARKDGLLALEEAAGNLEIGRASCRERV